MMASIVTAAPARVLAPASRPIGVLRRCACGGQAGPSGECEACRAKRLGLRRSASSPATASIAPPLVHDVLRSPGLPLDAGTRAALEPRFGHSFADVRIHADDRASESAAAVSAHAYTVGRDVVFGAGRYAPATMEGRRLIAHELAHVIQQSSSGSATLQPRLEIGAVDAPEERAADAAADAVLRGSGMGAEGRRRHADTRTFALSHSRTFALPVLRRSGPDSTEEMHHTVAEQWRAEHGLPPGGVDAEGRRVGPTDAEITHGPATLDRRPACPSPSDVRALLCLGAERSTEQITCRLTTEHHRILAGLRRRALVQVQGANRRLSGASEGARGLIQRQAGRSFAGRAPSWERIRAVVGTMETVLGSETLRFEGAGCGDRGCHSALMAAYVDAPGRMPIYICMHSFNPSLRESLMRTIVHEVAHVAGVAAATPAEEDYCENARCDEQCRGPEHADAWEHFIHCIGGPALSPPADFNDRIIRDVEGRL